jgi:hypothetical protein
MATELKPQEAAASYMYVRFEAVSGRPSRRPAGPLCTRSRHRGWQLAEVINTHYRLITDLQGVVW